MVAQIIKDTIFRKPTIKIDPDEVLKYECEEKFRQTLAHLFGYSPSLNAFIPLKVSAAGEISTIPELITAREVFKLSATVTPASQAYSTIFKHHIISNQGANAAIIEFDSTITTNSFRIPAGLSLSIDLEFKTLHYKAEAGTTDIYLLGTK